MADACAPCGTSGWHGACPYIRQLHSTQNYVLKNVAPAQFYVLKSVVNGQFLCHGANRMFKYKADLDLLDVYLAYTQRWEIETIFYLYKVYDLLSLSIRSSSMKKSSVFEAAKLMPRANLP